MIDPSLQSDLLKYLGQLPLALQQRVLDFARALKPTPEGTPGDQLLRLAGSMTHEEAEEMMQAIEEDCGYVQPPTEPRGNP